jgi:hypothetical protein
LAISIFVDIKFREQGGGFVALIFQFGTWLLFPTPLDALLLGRMKPLLYWEELVAYFKAYYNTYSYDGRHPRYKDFKGSKREKIKNVFLILIFLFL